RPVKPIDDHSCRRRSFLSLQRTRFVERINIASDSDPLDRGARTPLSDETVQEVHRHIRGRGLISSLALGISDGLITNLAFLAGFAGAIGNSSLIRLAGTASMLAGAASMFFGAFLAMRSEADLFGADSKREANEIEQEPDEERRELTKFYRDKGLTREEADTVVSRVTSDKEKWLEDILLHELHLHKTRLEDPYKAALVTGVTFLLGAFVPLSVYLVFPPSNYTVPSSLAVSLCFLYFVGAWKGKIVGRQTWKSGLEMLLIG